jgi:hypothetical protein
MEPSTFIDFGLRIWAPVTFLNGNSKTKLCQKKKCLIEKFGEF